MKKEKRERGRQQNIACEQERCDEFLGRNQPRERERESKKLTIDQMLGLCNKADTVTRKWEKGREGVWA